MEKQEKKNIIQKSKRETRTEQVEGIEHTKYLEITEKYRLSFVEHACSTPENKAVSQKQ